MTKTSNATLVLGRGELYFNRFTAGAFVGEGERHLGNTPGFTISRDVEEIERFTSYGGQQIQIGSLITREVQSASITTDNIDMNNVAMWFGNEADTTGQEAIGSITEEIVVRKGCWYQLGTSVEPIGVRHVEPDVAFSIGGTVISLSGNLDLDRTEGRFFVLEDAVSIGNGDTLSIAFQWRQSDSVTVSEVSTEVVGSLRYIAKNPIGDNISYLFPYIRIKPSSEIDMKADGWQEISFDVDIRRLNALTKYVYVRKDAGPLMTDDEISITELGPMALDDFPYFEDLLDQIINVFIPAADYGQVIP